MASSRGIPGLCFTVFFLFVAPSRSANSLDVNGANVCFKLKSYTLSQSVSNIISKKIKTTVACSMGWKRCPSYRTKYELNMETIYVQGFKKELICCKGWEKSGKNCSHAICRQPCVNGTCTKPDHCTCNPGYYGNLCVRDCPSHKWGAHCVHNCLCKNNAKCSPHDGTCTCAPGWEGNYCDKPCDQGYYGDKCQQNCICQNGATCEPISGNCTCALGYQGTSCESQCSVGWYGQDCGTHCACLNGAACDHVNGTCNCTAECKDWKFGLNCTKSCLCNATLTERCHGLSGVCFCKDGYTGPTCSTKIGEQASKKHQTDDTSYPIVPVMTSGIVAGFLVICVAVGVFVFWRRRKRSKHNQPICQQSDRVPCPELENFDQEIPDYIELFDVKPAGSSTKVATDSTTERQKSIQCRKPRDNPASTVAMECYYMDLSNPGTLENQPVYESLDELHTNQRQTDESERRGNHGDYESISNHGDADGNLDNTEAEDFVIYENTGSFEVEAMGDTEQPGYQNVHSPRDSTPRDSTPRDSTPRDSTPRDSTPRDNTPRDCAKEETYVEIVV